ncbi:MAG: hypothetical protein KA140_07070 [Caldisericia bacterium]|nr:hypothetical protein [Caldisericia bacterium]
MINYLIIGLVIVAIILVAVFVAFLLKIYKLSPGIVGIVFDFVAIVMILSNGFFTQWTFLGSLWANPLWLLFLAFGVIFGLFAVSETEQRMFGYVAISIPATITLTVLTIMYLAPK